IEESGIAQAIDPAGGSGFIEARTDDLVQAAWSVFQSLESQGGALACYKDDVFANLAIAGKANAETALVEGAPKMLGVTLQPDTAAVADRVVDGWCADEAAIARPAKIIEEFRRKAAARQPRIICLLPSGEMDKAMQSLKTQSDQLCAIGGLSVMTLVCGDNTEDDIRAAKPDVIIYIDRSLDDIADLRMTTSGQMPDITYVAAADITGANSLIDALDLLLGTAG
ncbi:MAG: methylmalonyl-CoA mutase family protein, partial [Candidatus Puniceispirillum sp.]